MDFATPFAAWLRQLDPKALPGQLTALTKPDAALQLRATGTYGMSTQVADETVWVHLYRTVGMVTITYPRVQCPSGLILPGKVVRIVAKPDHLGAVFFTETKRLIENGWKAVTDGEATR